jgi:hypothetical protein
MTRVCALGGAQEKTALLWHNGGWMRPYGAIRAVAARLAAGCPERIAATIFAGIEVGGNL